MQITFKKIDCRRLAADGHKAVVLNEAVGTYQYVYSGTENWSPVAVGSAPRVQVFEFRAESGDTALLHVMSTFFNAGHSLPGPAMVATVIYDDAWWADKGVLYVGMVVALKRSAL